MVAPFLQDQSRPETADLGVASGDKLRLQLLGHMAVTDQHGRTFLPRTRKGRALLAILAMASPKPVLRLQVAGLLWSQRQREQARASLRQSVHELQDTLGYHWSHILVADRHHLSLRDAALTIDTAELSRPNRDTADILDQFANVLLEDLNGLDPAFDRWLHEERARLMRIGRAVGESLLARCGDPESAIDTAEQLLLIDRTHEGAWRTIMRAHWDRGDRASALLTYDRCRTALAEATLSPPSPETEELTARIRAAGHGVRADPPPPLAGRIDPRRDRLGPGLRLCIAPLRSVGVDTDDGLAAGLAEEISAGLSRFRWISCVPASLWQGNPTGNAADATWAGQEADLVLDGTIQRAPPRVRIIIRLIDMRAGGEIVWAGRFDRDGADPLALQDEVGAAIVAQIDPELMKHEGRRSAGRRAHEMSGQDLLLQALPAVYRMERAAFLDARTALEAALRADPGSSVAHGWLAYWHLLFIGQGWADDPDAAAAAAAVLAERAVSLDPGDARALTLAGHVRGFLGKRPAEAMALHERALLLNPNLAIAWCFSGLAHSYLGSHEEAVRRINQARRLSPSDPHLFFFDMALCMPHLMRGDYLSAVDSSRRAIEMNPWFSSAYKGHLAALGHLDRPREAADVLRRLMELEPGFSVQQAMRRSPLVRPEDIELYAEGLRRAGLPEGTPTEVAAGRGPVPRIDQTAIDLLTAAPHIRPAMRIDPPTFGRLRNEST